MSDAILAGRELLRKVDAVIDKAQSAGESDNAPRFYCGASAVGKECARERWYDFRWASERHFEPRMLRLFDRGHKEERRVLGWLGSVGAEIRATSQWLAYHEGSDSYRAMEWDCDMPQEPVDDVTDLEWHRIRAKEIFGIELDQWGFKAHGGHFSGHTDGKIRYVPGQELWVPADEWIIFECKTHGSKSFAELVGGQKDREAWLDNSDKLAFPGKAVAGSKPEHVVQSQHYMHHLGARLALYAAVNKDTDDIHFEFIPYDKQFFVDGESIIREVIHSPKPPRRISAKPTYYKCQMCDHRRTCHFGERMQKNCRTCVFSHAIDGGAWACRKWNDKQIPREAQLVGCAHWTEIKD